MALASNYAARNVALELGGKIAGFVSALTLPGYEIQPAVQALGPGGETKVQGANVAITPMQARFNVSEPGPLLDWALTLARGVTTEQDGAALLADQNAKAQRRVDWRGGLLTELRLPVLDAKDGKKPFEVGLTWQPESISHASGGGPVKWTGTVRKPLLAANFQVKGLPFASSDIVRVELPTLKALIAEERIGMHRLPTRHYSRVELGPLTLQGAAHSREAALAYVQKVIRDGAITDEEYFDLTVEMHDPTFKKVLATVSLKGCGLLGYQEEPIEAGVDKITSYRLTFSVSQLDLKVNPVK